MAITDEQLREQFEDWGRTYHLNLIRTRGGQYQDVLAEVAYAAWRASNAEVQVLEAALTTAQDALLKVGHRLAKVHEDADGAKIALDAHYATQKTEGKAVDAD